MKVFQRIRKSRLTKFALVGMLIPSMGLVTIPVDANPTDPSVQAGAVNFSRLNTANLTINPLEAVTTVTVQIVTLLVGDQEFDSAKTLAAFALGLLLFVVTLVLNVIALHVVRRSREEYE